MAEAPPLTRHMEPWWVKASYLTAAAVAAGGDWLFVSAASTNWEWTAYLGTYLALAAAIALVGGMAGPGVLRSASRAAATGAASAFVLLGAASIGILFIPLAAWLALSTLGGERLKQNGRTVTAAAITIAFIVPIVGLVLVYGR